MAKVEESEKVTHSSNDDKDYYLRGIQFWREMQFWERDSYTEEGKQYHRERLRRMVKEEKKLINLI